MSRDLFAYGTLRGAGGTPAVLENFRRRTDAPFPTIEPDEGSAVEGVLVGVDDWAEKDRYEGRDPADPARSLYWRLGMADGTQVYVGNPAEAERAWGRSWSADYDMDAVETALAGAVPEVIG